ncbi:hypothetical protein [Vibrio neptunius]|uniref:hypothetical protein n=1 Tax=Vibrio neptunius TaxID=170651 RepID=UPI0019D281FA|nr:hypothetical protein [Vibrio neptunius]MBN3573651.1 hypothetical protein [Vibrio neptunius]
MQKWSGLIRGEEWQQADAMTKVRLKSKKVEAMNNRKKRDCSIRFLDSSVFLMSSVVCIYQQKMPVSQY